MTIPTPGFDPPRPPAPADPLPDTWSLTGEGPTTTDPGASIPTPGPDSTPPPAETPPPTPGSNPTPGPGSTRPGLDDETADPAAFDAWERDAAPPPTPGSSREHQLARQVAETSFRTIGGALHSRLTPDELFGASTLWIPDDDDVEHVAGPLARIAQRHLPTTTGPLGDVSDAIEAGVAMTNYVLKHAGTTRALHQALAAQHAATPPPADTP